MLSLVPAADRLALIGRNGSGKSSLFKMISGEVRPDAGQRAEQDTPGGATLPRQIPDFDGNSIEDVLQDQLEGMALEAGKAIQVLAETPQDLLQIAFELGSRGVWITLTSDLSSSEEAEDLLRRVENS